MMTDKCLYPDKNGELCRKDSVYHVTKQKRDAPDLGIPICQHHLNQILEQHNLKVELL